MVLCLRLYFFEIIVSWMHVDLLYDILSEDICWKNVFSFPDVDDCVHYFTLVLQGLLDAVVPLHQLCVHKDGSDPWLTTTCNARSLRNRFYCRALHTGYTEDWLKFWQSRNKYTYFFVEVC